MTEKNKDMENREQAENLLKAKSVPAKELKVHGGAPGDFESGLKKGLRLGERRDRKRKKGDEDDDHAGQLGAEGSEFIEKVIAINRITKVTKGGKKMSFSALVVVGDTKGNVGYSLSKAGEVSVAIRKAMATAKKNMVRIPLKGTTIPHEIIGRCSGSRVLLKPAGDGTGVIAAGPVRAVCDGAGIRNILTKCHRSNNPINVVKATMDGLTRLKSTSAVVAVE